MAGNPRDDTVIMVPDFYMLLALMLGSELQFLIPPPLLFVARGGRAQHARCCVSLVRGSVITRGGTDRTVMNTAYERIFENGVTIAPLHRPCPYVVQTVWHIPYGTNISLIAHH